MFGIVIMKKKTLAKLINGEVDKAAYNGYTLGYKMGQVERGNRHLLQLSRSDIDLEIARILKEKGF